MKRLTMIVAIADDDTIGDKGKVPWTLPADMAHFRAATLGRSVLMGRRTWASLPEEFQPLPGRRNIVVSESGRVGAGGAAEVYPTLDEAIAAARTTDREPIIIGGAVLYRAALPQVTRILLTQVHLRPDGDTRYDFDRAGFCVMDLQRHVHKGVHFSFIEFQRYA